MQYISGALIAVSLVASFYFGTKALIKPEGLEVYNLAGISHFGIQLWGVYLMLSSLLLLFPKTFVFANGMMLVNTIFTITSFLIIKDFKGAGIEILNGSIPVILLLIGYPKVLLDLILNSK